MTDVNMVPVHASRMADIMQNCMMKTEQEVYITSSGMQQLGDYFDSVEYELRAAVFEWFLVELNRREIEYDTNMFNTGAVN